MGLRDGATKRPTVRRTSGTWSSCRDTLTGMKILAWNLNHRAAKRRIPTWIGTAIAEQAPDVVVLTEYVEGLDHASFLETLKVQGLGNYSLTSQPGGENQLLIVSRDAQRHCQLNAPDIHRSVMPNILEVSFGGGGVTILGFRMPAFEYKDRLLKRQTWDWLLTESDRLRDRPALLVGDFNTAPGDPKADCGDCLEELVGRGWQHARPATGYSWRHSQSGNKRLIDHIFLSASLVPRRVEYLWEFERLAPPGASRKIGLPDHAMLVAEFDQVPAPSRVAK